MSDEDKKTTLMSTEAMQFMESIMQSAERRLRDGKLQLLEIPAVLNVVSQRFVSIIHSQLAVLAQAQQAQKIVVPEGRVNPEVMKNLKLHS